MSLTVWNKDFELGIEQIDEHHRTLVDLLNDSYTSVLHSRGTEEIQATVNELIKYSVYHFDAEESMMREADYPRLKTHVAKHRVFRKKLATMKEATLSGTSNVSSDIVLLLWEWLHDHIQKDDKKLAAHLMK